MAMFNAVLHSYDTGVLLVLDARPGGIIYRDIIPEYVNFARTIYEGLISLFSCSHIELAMHESY